MTNDLRIFISYRREDSRGVAGRIRDSLASELGEGNVFFDVYAMPLGVDFRSHLATRVGECDALLAVIGRQWIDIVDADGERRLENEVDYVRLEIEAALARSISVIPLLVDDAEMPAEADLPLSIASLAYRHGMPIRHDPDYHNDIRRLLDGLLDRTPSEAPGPAVPGTVSYATDLVLCVDRSPSMRSILDLVAGAASALPSMLEAGMRHADKAIRQLRVRLIMFGPPGDARLSLDATRFYTLPVEQDEFTRIAGHITVPFGPEDQPSYGLDALAAAIQSPWERTLAHRRHTVVLWTNSGSVALGELQPSASFPVLAESTDDLNAMWGDEVDEGLMEFAAKRLIVVGPDAYPWRDLSELFENCIWIGAGTTAETARDALQTIVDQVCSSV